MMPSGAKRLFRFPWRSRAALRADVQEEFQFHLDMRTAELVASGLSEPDARARALHEFGDPATGADACLRVDADVERRTRAATLLEELGRDVALGLRLLGRQPAFSLIAVATLALGIGANAAIYSMFDQMLSRPLPVHAPHDLVNLGAPGPKPGSDNCNQAGTCDDVFSYPMYEDLSAVPSGFSGIAAHRAYDITLSPDGSRDSEWGMGMIVSGNYFDVLGLTPAAGRFMDSSDVASGAPVAVISHEYWRARFNEDPGVVGRAVIVNGHVLSIVGVAPRGFSGTTLGIRAVVFLPISSVTVVQPGAETLLQARRSYWLYLFARLAPGVSRDQAHVAINGPYQRILADVEAPLQVGLSDQTLSAFMGKQVALSSGARGQSRLHAALVQPLTLLFLVTAVVLLIACANIANLQLARAAGRAGEMAVRLSIGGSRWQLVRQLVIESCVLAAAGGAAGLLVAYATLAGITRLLPQDAMDTRVAFALDPSAMLFAGVLALGSGIAFGLVPAVHATKPDVLSTLKDQSGQPSGARTAARFRTALATVQIALAMTLLVAAGLFMRSLVNVSNVDLGLDPDRVVSFAVAPGLHGYSHDESRLYFERLEATLAAMPGASSASASLMRVLSGHSNGANVRVEGFEAGPDTDVNVRVHGIGASYFRTMGMTLLAGRTFTPADGPSQPKVAIVNEAFAAKFQLGPNPVGKRLARSRDAAELDIEIVGLVRDAKYADIKRDTPPVLFQPYQQTGNLFGMYFYVRSALPPEQALAAIPTVVAAIDPGVPVRDLMTVPQQLRQSVFLDRMIGILSTAFAVLATLMAALGLYGVLAYTIAQRTREIGLRMALGAAPGQVRGMILRQVAWMTIAGGTIGLAMAAALGAAAQSLLFGLGGFDPLVVSVSAVLLSLVALTAGFVPAVRASRIDPMRALRWN
ncbi:MAG: ABC transporter permease [Vicinamibacterales bacterium]|nr:ABC transporter permease [Vicinamibacterales bacterium]